MKCPKCAYVGFEAADRCRHCGYEFSLIDARGAAAPSRVLDLEARDPAARAGLSTGAAADAELTRPQTAPLADLPLSTPAGPSLVTSARFSDQPPLPARTPLAVRRTAERPRSRATPHVVRRPRQGLLEARTEDLVADQPATARDTAPVAAPSVARLASALLDVALLATIDVVVVYLTAQMAGVPVADVATLPLVPLCAFVLGLNVAYVAVFTANGGQTLGKMAMGLRVETTDGPLTFGGAIVRVMATLIGGLVMGVGFIPALWRDDRRAVHDQIAHTRVVKISA